MVHNHPEYNSPPSDGDLEGAFNYSLQTVIAVSREGKYYFRLKDKFINSEYFKVLISEYLRIALKNAKADRRYIKGYTRDVLNANAIIIHEYLKSLIESFGVYSFTPWGGGF